MTGHVKTPLLNTVDYLTKNLDDRKQTDVILLDFSKAIKSYNIKRELKFHIVVFKVAAYLGLKIFLLGDYSKSL